MSLNIKNEAVERLAADVAALTGETKTEAVRRALEERKARLQSRTALDGRGRILQVLQREIWPHISPQEMGRPLSREEEDEILGYGPTGL